MLIVLLIGRLFLFGVFVVAGIMKLADRLGSRKSLIDFGLPKALASGGAVLLPLAEIAVGLCLIPARLAWYGSVGALALLSLFILAIGMALLRGRKPDCHCFGQLHSKPIGPGLLLRNIALGAIPSLLLYAGNRQPAISSPFLSLTPGEMLLLLIASGGLALLCFLSWTTFQLMQQGGRVLLRLDALEHQMGGAPAQPHDSAEGVAPAPGLPIGQPAPDFALEALDGGNFSLVDLLGGSRPLMLLFTHPACGPCGQLLPEAARWQQEHAAHFKLVLVSEGNMKENHAKLNGHKLPVLLQKGTEVATAYQSYSTPSAVLIKLDGTIGSSIVSGAEAIRTLVANTINESLASLVSINIHDGEKAPPLMYPDLDGYMFSLSELRGTPTALLFWNTACGFCQQMLPDLQAWENRAAKTAPKLLVISAGSVDDNRKLGLKSRIVLDQHFSAGRAFGVGGTPSGLLLDSDCRLISNVAVGRQQILETILSERRVATARA
jgi:peroxiredoxin